MSHSVCMTLYTATDDESAARGGTHSWRGERPAANTRVHEERHGARHQWHAEDPAQGTEAPTQFTSVCAVRRSPTGGTPRQASPQDHHSRQGQGLSCGRQNRRHRQQGSSAGGGRAVFGSVGESDAGQGRAREPKAVVGERANTQGALCATGGQAVRQSRRRQPQFSPTERCVRRHSRGRRDWRRHSSTFGDEDASLRSAGQRRRTVRRGRRPQSV